MFDKRLIPTPAAGDPRAAAVRDEKPPRRRFRFNFRAAAILALVAVVGGAALFSLREVGAARVREQAIAEAVEAEKSGNVNQAIRTLRRLLDSHRDDLRTLEMLARMATDSARSVNEAMEAARLNDQLLRRDPEGPGRQETRRRMVELYVRAGDAHRTSAVYRLMPDRATHDLRYRAAERIARDLLDRDGKKAEPRDHRLLGMALEGLAVPGTPEALEGSIREYRAALQGDPADVVASERLARLYQERKNDPAEAVRILDALERAAPDSPEVRLARHRYFAGVHRNDLAATELEKATELAGGDPKVRLAAADDALRSNDTAAARRHLAALPESMQADLSVRVMRGMIEFAEERPDEAVNNWRQGLMMIGGTDGNLTWWLAHKLLQMGRIAEARPLVAQFRRLSGEETEPLYRLLQAELDEKSGRPARAIVDLEWARDKIGEYWRPLLQIDLGRCYEALSDRARALAAYRKALQFDPRQADARTAVARLLAARPDEAAEEIERGLSLSPEDPSLLSALAQARLLQQAALPSSRRNWAEFDRALAGAEKAAPANSSLLAMRADRLLLSGDPAGAAALLEKGTSRSPRNGPLWTARAEALFRTGKAREALEVLDRAAAPGAAGDRASIRICRAKILLALDRGREASEGLTRGEKDLALGDRPLIWEAAGRLDTARGDFRAAQASFTEWARLLPDDPRPRLAMLELAQAVGDEATVRSIVDALEKLGGPQDIAWRVCRAQELLWTLNSSGLVVQRRDAKLLEAGRILDSVLADAPEVSAAHQLRGEVMEKLGRPDEAAASYRRAWERGNTAALPRLVEVLIRNGKFEELNGLRLKVESTDLDRLSAAASIRIGDDKAAARFVRQAMEDAKNSPASLAWQAEVFETIGRPDEAEAALRAIVNRDPSALAPWLGLIRSQAGHGKARDALATAERARGSIRGEEPGVLEARLRWAAGDRPGADKAFEAALAARGSDVDLRILASQYYDETGRPAEAAACLRGALKIDPKNRGAARQMAVELASDPATWPKALELFGDVPRVDDTPDDRLARAMVMSRAPDPARRNRAVELYRDLAEDLPADSPIASSARTQLAAILLESGQPEKAAEVAAVSARSTTDAATVTVYIEALLRSQRWPEAIRQIDRLAAIRPGDATEAALRVRWIRLTTPPAGLAEALEKAVKDRLAWPGGEAFERQSFNALVEMGPTALERAERVGQAAASRRAHASWMPAQILAARGQDARALELCRASVSSPILEDRWGAAMVAMAVAQRSESDAALLARVEQVVDDVARRDPKKYALDMLSAFLRHLQGRYEDEVRLYREALILRPGDPEATNNLAWSLSEGLNRPDEALPLVDSLIARRGRRPEILDTRGVILTRLNRLDEAIADLQEFVRAAPSAIGHFHLALACRKAGRDDEFRKSREQARRAGLAPPQADRTERPEVASMMQF